MDVDRDAAMQGKRLRMVRAQLAGRGVADRRLLEAMAAVPRERFVSPELAGEAYADRPLPIGSGQTISQPYVVALMIDALSLRKSDRVLEIGTGSGYAAAVLGLLAGHVYSMERHRALVERARAVLDELGYDNVEVCWGDGTLGLPGEAPFDAIVVAAAGPTVPPSLQEQLASGGRLVMPVGSSGGQQELVRVTRDVDGGFQRESLGPVRFVPLIGEEGFASSVE